MMVLLKHYIPNYTTDLINKQDKYLSYSGPITFNTTSKDLKVDAYNTSEIDVSQNNKSDKTTFNTLFMTTVIRQM